MANNLPREKQIAVISALIEGYSIRSTERMPGVNRQTVGTLLERVGAGCADLLDERMVDLPCERLEIDELWVFVAKKKRHVRRSDDASRVGDTWTCLAIDDEHTKVIPAFLVGKRTGESTCAFIADLASRLRNRVQISTDGLRAYGEAIGDSFGRTRVDYAELHKPHKAEASVPGRYSPPKVTSTEKTPAYGELVTEHVSTSYGERQNLSVRMGIGRYTRLTNGYSKKIENHIAATALFVAHHNLVRQHHTLRVTPTMEAGLEQTIWSVGGLLDATIGGAP